MTADSELIDHGHIMIKLVEHEDRLVSIVDDLHGINQKLDPIAHGVASMAFFFKVLLVVGAGSAAVVGLLELVERLG